MRDGKNEHEWLHWKTKNLAGPCFICHMGIPPDPDQFNTKTFSYDK